MSQPNLAPQTAQRPCVTSYSQRSSGDVQTGEFQHVRGGGRAATIWSGAVAPSLAGAPGAIASGGNILFYSGAGRLNSIIQHVQMQSGLAIQFYDGAGVASGGPFAASGHKLLGTVPAVFQGSYASGYLQVVPFTGQPILLDVPFQSGLQCNVASGAPGFTITFTPEVSVAFPGI